MDYRNWFQVNSGQAAMVIVSAVIIYCIILLYTRIVGLRSFSKMSASDFAMTVAVGSLFASAISNPSPTIGVAIIALASLYAGQWILAQLRMKSDMIERFVCNQPLLLMREGQFLYENLSKANVTEDDVIAKLREANVLEMKEVRAVIFETTGDISVLHSHEVSRKLEGKILQGVGR